MHRHPSPSGRVVRASNRPGARGFVRVAAVGAAVLLVAAGGIWAVTRGGGGSSDMRTVAAVDLARVERGSFPINTTAMGELEARNQIELRSQLDTRADIVEIVAEGTVVKKGDLLVQLNAEDLQDQIDQQTLEVERAEADVIAAENALKIQISQNESQERAAQLKIDLAQLALDQWLEGDVKQTRSSQQLELEQAERDLERLQEKYDLSKQLNAEGFLSNDQLKSDFMDLKRAEARLETAALDKKTYEEFQYPRDEKTKNSDLQEAIADLERVRTQNEINKGAKQSSLDTTRRQFELKAERLEKLKEQVSLARIEAPADGLVVYATSVGRDRDRMMFGGDGPLQIGSEVRPNQNLIILPDTSSMVASVRVHESLAGRLRPGQPATITVDAQSDITYAGRVTSIGVLAESGGWRDPNRREYSVRIAVDHNNADGTLKPSMRVEAEIMLGAVEDALMVPVQAVFSDGPVKFVYRPKGPRYERVPIEVGRMSDTFAEVVSGLEEGDPVLLREPSAGEVAPGDWTPEQLEAVGIALDEDGNPVSANARADMMRRMMQNGMQGGPGGMTVSPGGRNGGELSQRQGGRPEGAGQGSADGAKRPGAAGASDGQQKPQAESRGAGAAESRSAKPEAGQPEASGGESKPAERPAPPAKTEG